MSPETKPAKPIDIFDVMGLRKTQHPAMGDHWYWCRRHTRAEHFGWAMDGCVRVGPFMTEAEANRLGGLDRHNKPDDFAVDCWGSPMTPLGMEVEA